MSEETLTPVAEQRSASPVVTTVTVEPGHPMEGMIDSIPTPPREGDLIEGTIIELVRGRLFVDLPPFGTGIIYGREYLNAADVLRKANPGDTISAKVVDAAGLDGYIELSLKEARQAAIWSEAEQAIAGQTVFTLPVEEANKGGLILSWQGIQGFLPASQLTKEHYPRVPEGDKDKIFSELQRLTGTMLTVRIITADAKEGKLIFSERGGEEETEKASLIDKYQVGDVIEGEVTGAVDFGVFVKLEQGLEGLVHISELDWGLVEDPRTLFKVGDAVKVKVIEVKDGKVSLSVKALKENPWKTAQDRYKKGMEVSGAIIKYNKHGALASIEEGVAGLVHISEFESPAGLREALELGKTYPFTITLFEPKDQRMTLSYVGPKKK
ncbi:S1 RNA-binding domain-containing protein [Patescibacteria group bacterium]|nr:S1 RNA-binding domain-containing protein [Patescibacteria group bacterium]MBU1500785.1 S1 RNA-binding domain-containing protein [Patescibacteria group bacterium]MBU2080840.1 S1 RNA-binding domain-containing protein [Patescibacteria group bacterium]MBU2123945.1 S1 RNA-binding domain-containing protein [Patescibacteria group bacterium]MBU2194764.1 S1 RNA-binding domain-containing protein [Patescibacteria group bacterium]